MSIFLTGGLKSFGQLIVVLLIFVVVLGITAFTTRWVANFQKKQGVTTGMEIIDGLRISPNKMLQIVRIGDKYVCIAVGKDEINYICDVDPESIKKEEKNTSFSGTFEKALGKLEKKENTDKVDE